jgi:hypothetical protein
MPNPAAAGAPGDGGNKSRQLAEENETKMNQALLLHDNRRRRSLELHDEQRLKQLLEEERTNNPSPRAEAPEEENRVTRKSESESEPAEETDDLEEAQAAVDLEHEHDDLMAAKGATFVFLTAQYNSRVVVLSDSFNYFIIIVIIIAGINVGVQTYSEDPLLSLLDAVILICFSVEVLLKILAEGFKPWRYWTGKDWKWNNFDFTIVFMSLPFWGGLFGSGSLALLRLVRLMRLGKLIKKIPALQMIVQGLTGGLSSIGYILILLFLVYYLFAVVGFYFFGENDPFLFGNIPMAMITLFRCSTLDAWSDIMNMNIYGCSHYFGLYIDPADDPTVPSALLCEHPHAQLGLAGIYFVCFIVISAMVMLSLFIGTVTMSMNQSMENLRLLSERKRKREAYLKNKAIFTAQIMEGAAKAGNIKSRSTKSEPPDNQSKSELYVPVQVSSIVRSQSTGHALAPDQDVLFKEQEGPIDGAGKSHPTTAQFEMDSFKPHESHASLHRAMYVQSVLQHQQDEDPDQQNIGGPFAFVYRFRRKTKAIFMTDTNAEQVQERQDKTKRYLLKAMGEDVPDSESEDPMHGHGVMAVHYLHFCNGCRRIAEDERFVNFVTMIIVMAGVVVGLQTDPRVLAVQELNEALNILNWVILAVFTLECVLKITGNGFTPWRYFSDGWNRFDFIIVVGSYVPGAGSLLVILRLLRLLRVLKLLKSLPQLAVILSAMMLGIGSIGYIALILFLVFYVFAILGMLLFATNDPWHFGSLHMAMITLFRVSTLDDWHKVLYINMFGCDQYGSYNAVYAEYPDACTNPKALGFIAVFYFVLFVIIGAQVLLTLFIGVVTTSMDQATESRKALCKLEERVSFVANRFTLSANQISNFRNCFELLDLDNGGTIEEEELKIGLQIVNSTMPDDEISKRMKAADPSVDGVDLVGFIIFMCNLPKFKQKRMFLKILRLFRFHKKKKMEASRKAHFYQKASSALSPRSAAAAAAAAKSSSSVHHDLTPRTNNSVTGVGAAVPSVPSVKITMAETGMKAPEATTATDELVAQPNESFLTCAPASGRSAQSQSLKTEHFPTEQLPVEAYTIEGCPSSKGKEEGAEEDKEGNKDGKEGGRGSREGREGGKDQASPVRDKDRAVATVELAPIVGGGSYHKNSSSGNT